MTTNLPVYARNIHALAARTGLSHSELARRAKLSRDAFHRYVTGKTRPPVEKGYILADLFSVNPTDIDPDRKYLRQQGAPFRPLRLEPAPTGQVYPACAGINRRGRSWRGTTSRSIRMRGDRPKSGPGPA